MTVTPLEDLLQQKLTGNNRQRTGKTIIGKTAKPDQKI